MADDLTADGSLSFTLMGDIMPGGDFAGDFANLRQRYLPAEIKSWLQSDLVFANLECVASSRGRPLADKIALYTSSETLGILDDLGVDVVSLANNHQMDYGIEASEDTRRLLDSLGIRYGGVGRSLEEARRPVLLERRGLRIIFLFFSWTRTYLEPVPEAGQDRPGVSPYDLEEIEACLRAAESDLRPDYKIVSLHWGEGLSHYARPESVREAHRIIDAGADMIVGHHAHCLQGYEVYRGKPIFYGLGNFFCSRYLRLPDQRLTYGAEGEARNRSLRERRTVIARVEFDGERRVSVSYRPLLQQESPPILTLPTARMERRIRRELERYSRRLRSPGYDGWRFGLYRRVDELRRMIEDLREFGWRAEYGSLTTWKRVVRKLATGKSVRRDDRQSA
jgi:hypothetical protein